MMKRGAALLLCLVMLLQFAGCKDGDAADVTTGAPPASGNVAEYASVWSAPSTV